MKRVRFASHNKIFKIIVGFLSSGIILLILSSCDINSYIPSKIDDSRFDGTFYYSYHWEDSHGIEEENIYQSFTFHGNNKAYYYFKYSSYSINDGWDYSGDYLGDHYFFTYKVEVSNGRFRYKLWDIEDDDWSNWFPYEFRDNGNTLVFHDYYRTTSSDLVLRKINY